MHQVFQEAEILGATRVKFAVGEFDPSAEEELTALKDILNQHTALVTVEGDQSPANGRIEPILALVEACRTKDIPVYATLM